MTPDLGRAERHALEIEALGNEISNRITAAVQMLKQYRRGYPTGSDGHTDPEAGACTRTEALALAGPDAVDRDERDLLHALERGLRELRVAYNITARYQQASIPRHAGRITVAVDEGWCASCVRDGGHLEPVWLGRYARFCRWCGEFHAAEGIEPPLPLLKARHQGRRITTAMVVAELAKVGRRSA